MEDNARIAALLAEVEQLRLEKGESQQAAELERHKLRQERDEVQQERDIFQQLVQNTTLDEFLEACHEELCNDFRVQENPKYSTLGGLTNPEGKSCPRSLEPWTEFPQIRDEVFGEIHDAFHPPSEALRELLSLRGIQDLRRKLKTKSLISSEAALQRYHDQAVEQHVTIILASLASIGPFSALGDGLEFHNHSHALRDGQHEVEQRRQSKNKNKKKTYEKVPQPANADQICVSRDGSETNLVFVEEMKAPHKLTQQFLEAGLREPVDVKEVRNRVTTSMDADEKYMENAQTLVAAAATQTYSYMLTGGIQYGCIITGEAIVFLFIDAEEPTTLYYHLATPSREVRPGDKVPRDYSKTTVAQLTTFAVLASRTPQHPPDWRTWAIGKADRWEVDYATLEHELETPRNERRKSLPSSEYKYKGRIGKSARNIYNTRSKRRDHDDDGPDNDDNSNGHSSAGSSDGTADTYTPSKSKEGRSKDVSHQKGGGQGSFRKHAQPDSEYCTQACLLGLVHNTAIDKSCPNAVKHPRSQTDYSLHLIGLRTLRRLIREQLGTTLNTNITDLKVHGARGMLFRLVLATHGYTFVGKGTIDVFVPDLKHEGAMYGRLRSFQGKDIPVYLGNIDLERIWYDYGIRIVHMLLMSWGGDAIRTTDERMRTQISAFEVKLSRLGIQHGDLRAVNMLWNKELQRLIFIDFERSTVQRRTKQRSRKVLGEISPNKPTPMGGSTTNKSPDKKSPSKVLRSSENKVTTAAAFTIFDEENVTLQLPLPSPRRLSVGEQWLEDEPASKQHSPVRSLQPEAPPLTSYLGHPSEQVTCQNVIH
ncbi:MAG: hypothetical protein L6R39_006764 [Caloplaca ligustica]|nr:MAG: hypothetical protein L6R39_006764 [Caloplaca ligustica]